jgi:Family of unknown function (DUF6345)/Dockerin type I domain
MKIINFYLKVSVIPGIIICLIIFCTILSADNSVLQRVNTDYSPGFDLRKNLCSNSEITSPEVIYDNAYLISLIDDNYTCGVSSLDLESIPIQLRFVGRVPWVNTVRIYHGGKLDIKLQVKDVYKRITQIDFSSEIINHGDGFTESVFYCDDMRISALVISFSYLGENNQSEESPEIFEIEAFYETSDSDDGDEEVGVEYVQYYKHRPCGGSNIKGTKSDALDFRNKLHDNLGWTKKFSWGNYDAYAQDFTTHNETNADDVDFVYFSGHGNDGDFQFSHSVMRCQVYYPDCYREWGNNDMEWIASMSCRTLRETSTKQYWAGFYNCFDGLHAMLGFHTNALDVNMGKYFGNQLARKHHNIWTAWKTAARKSHHANQWTNINKIVGIAEEEIHFSDHIWGAGSVAADFPNNGNYHYRTHRFRGWKKVEPTLSVDPSKLRPIIVPDQYGPMIFVTDELLNTAKWAPMPHYMVNPTVVSVGYVENITATFCSNYGIFCDFDLVYNQNEGEYEAFDGPHELEVLEASGGWEYNQTATYGMPTAAPPILPDDSDAQDTAQTFWTTFGLLDATAVVLDPECLEGGVIEASTNTEFEDSTYYMNVNVSHIRNHAGYYILGPGANLEVILGNTSELQSAYYGGWRDIYDAGTFEPITLGDALAYVAASGPEITIGGMPLCDDFIVDNAELGYYEGPMDSVISELQPVWQVNGFCVFEDDTTACQVLIPADYPIPQGIIQEPGQDTSINCNEVLFVYGSASGGTSPYIYDWYSDIDGYLGSGESLQVMNLSCFGKEGGFAGHTIILEITDENSIKDWASVNVRVIASYQCGDANSDQIVNVSDAVWIINYVFVGGDPPNPIESGDCNCDDTCNVSDAVWIINYVFVGGNTPCDTNGDTQPDC